MLYNKQDLRHKLFTQKNLSEDKLPQTLGELSLQLQRVWRLDGHLELERMIDDAVPDVVVKLTCCKCCKGCKTNSCSCRRAKLTCTEACLCNDVGECGILQQFDTNPSSNEED